MPHIDRIQPVGEPPMEVESILSFTLSAT